MCYLKEDLCRYFRKCNGLTDKIKVFLLTQGVWATTIYRAGSWCCNRKGKYFWVRVVLPFLTIFQKIIEITTGIVLPFTAKIGKGFYIGQAGRGGKQHTPIIGDRVYIAPGAKIFGRIKIGNDVAIGANAVVTKDLPDNAVAVGIPAQIISYKSSRDFVII